MVTGNVAYLRDNPPATQAELPARVGTADREQGVRTFRFSANSHAAKARGDDQTYVYYLDWHDKAAVLERFLKANPHLTEVHPRHVLHRFIGNHGEDWRAVAAAVTEQYYEGSDGSTNRTAGATDECPFCGDEVLKSSLPKHLETQCTE